MPSFRKPRNGYPESSDFSGLKQLLFLLAVFSPMALCQEAAVETDVAAEEAMPVVEEPVPAEPAMEPVVLEPAMEAEATAEGMPSAEAAPESAAEPAAEAAAGESEAAPAAEAAFAGTGATGEILNSAATSGAAVETLQAERKLLETIGKGVTLSLAECEGVDLCEPNVNKAELQQLVKTVEQRIEGLVQRSAESPDAAVDDLLIAYAIVRDTYSQQIDQLNLIAPEEEGPAEEGDLFGAEAPAEGATESAAMPDEFSIFEDADESLTDEPAPEDSEPEPAADEPM
jgi:hypothetical protein